MAGDEPGSGPAPKGPPMDRDDADDRDLIHPRDALLRTMERVYRYRMTTTSGGNLSVRDADGAVWITPARVDKGGLTRDDIVRVRPDGTAEGRHRPSSEFPFHRAIYAARADLRAIVHAHPVALVAFSIVGKVPDTRLLPTARRVCGPVGFAPYALPGSAVLGERIAATFAQGFHCAVLENHGVVTGGATLAEAFERFETLEFCAKTIIKAGQMGPVRTLSEAEAERPRPLLTVAPQARHEPPTAREKELRRELCAFVRRGYQQRLLISTQGAFSARLEGDSFLVTPHRVDRSALDLDDLVLVAGGVPVAGKRSPSSAAVNHLAIYRAHPDVHAIVTAYPVNATAFSVGDATLDARTIPESYLFLRDVKRVPYGAQFGDGRALAEATSPRQPVLLLDNDGVQVCGTSVLDAFDRLEVLESTAEAMINSRPLGPMVPMPDAALAELRRAFFGEMDG
jgi:L-fuculose-phosphate aldolase